MIKSMSALLQKLAELDIFVYAIAFLCSMSAEEFCWLLGPLAGGLNLASRLSNLCGEM